MNTNNKYDILNVNQDDELLSDPFGMKGLSGLIKGFSPMSPKQALFNYAQELVSQFAIFLGDYYNLSLDALPDSEQDELARLYIEAHEREVNECIYGDDFTINSDFTCALLSMLKNNCKLTREHFATITRKNILVYYRHALEQLLDEACEQYYLAVNDSYYRDHERDSDYEELGWNN